MKDYHYEYSNYLLIILLCVQYFNYFRTQCRGNNCLHGATRNHPPYCCTNLFHFQILRIPDQYLDLLACYHWNLNHPDPAVQSIQLAKVKFVNSFVPTGSETSPAGSMRRAAGTSLETGMSLRLSWLRELFLLTLGSISSRT